MIALSVDSVEDHLAWSKDIKAYNGEAPTEKLPFPIIDDKTQDLAILLGMLDAAEKDEKNMPMTARLVFIFGPDKKLSILYPATMGRNFDEILRVVNYLQLTAEKSVATPVDWKEGDSMMVLSTIPEEEAKTLFPKGVFTKELPSGKKYLRHTPQPKVTLRNQGRDCPRSTVNRNMPAADHVFLTIPCEHLSLITAWVFRLPCC